MKTYRVTESAPYIWLILLLSALSLAGSTVLTAWLNAPWWITLIMALSTLFVLPFAIAFRRIIVTVDRDGVLASWGGIFRKRVLLDEIQKVEVGPYKWLQFGGWGWRFNFKGDVAFSRLGLKDCLIVHRRNGRKLVVTLSNPDEALDAILDVQGA